ncbi:hypothetical protein LTR91_005825 [Friedmanniomyces endolithicus]|uniref:Uncharacterized protein n=2 Tax=Dothideomycetidae TaxID=451867 RepID=A0A4V5N4U5_9PEZI|nr:hypothetical protein LTS09_015457 [Friedmanniomyces endolithicus]KAK5142709.1 hypothetical protein LTR32_005011 [Rachicladosporium monterosium]KAK0261419.1 hypothetical protein LTS09_004132 [Friedmanniomyces endolithicus]KAK0288088.1 hypothetical protein LTR35_003562 [Friedmanniomyces endolithicus]KAK0294000.1 hypothetical protein LTS00_007339 [Friedmanniomyces endolithicus]
MPRQSLVEAKDWSKMTLSSAQASYVKYLQRYRSAQSRAYGGDARDLARVAANLQPLRHAEQNLSNVQAAVYNALGPHLPQELIDNIVEQYSTRMTARNMH